MNHPTWIAAAAALLCLPVAPAGATPSPPQSCAGQVGVGGCAPYTDIYLADGAGVLRQYEYDLSTIDIARSLPLSNARGTGDLQRGQLTAAARLAEDIDAGSVQGVDVVATFVDLYTLSSGGTLPQGATVGIVALASAQVWAASTPTSGSCSRTCTWASAAVSSATAVGFSTRSASCRQ